MVPITKTHTNTCAHLSFKLSVDKEFAANTLKLYHMNPWCLLNWKKTRVNSWTHQQEPGWQTKHITVTGSVWEQQSCFSNKR